MRAMFDINVILDVLFQRQPHASHSAQALMLVERGVIKGHLCSASAGTIHYMLCHQFDHQTALQHITTLRRHLHITNVDESIIDQALQTNWADFEDSIIHESAVTAGMDIIVTRDPKGFKLSNIPVLSPSELLAQSANLQDSL